jgi:hypothetical protein
MKYTVRYKKANALEIHEAHFDNLEDAQLWWDSIAYLRKYYQAPMEPRPQ